MLHTNKGQRQQVDTAVIAHRSAAALFLFSFVFLVLLVLSHLYLLPKVTTVEVAGSMRNAQELREYHDSLLKDLVAKEHERNMLVLPMEDSAYRRLVEMKHSQFPLLVLRSSLEQTARQLLPDDSNVVHVESMRYTPGEKRAELTGDIRNVGSRSMTVLAQLLEELRAQPFIADIASPRFRRVEDPRLGPTSPFTIRIKLL